MLAEIINSIGWVMFWLGMFVMCYQLIITLRNGDLEHNKKEVSMRFLLFGSEECFYAKGGANDYIVSGNSIDVLMNTANAYRRQNKIEWWHIFDTKTEKIIAGTKYQAHGADNLDILVLGF
ncbi:MAG: hypothetical protein RPR97_10735 [Colwellia sp.]